jgi:hypothetical protein
VFGTSEFDSNNGFLTTVWGPPLWHVLHTISFNYPVQPTAAHKRDYRAFVMSLQHVLPCGVCRNNLARNLKHHPPLLKHFASRDAFARYIYHLHNVVNRMTGKPVRLTFEQVRDRYEHLRARCAKPETPPASLHIGCTEPVYAGERAKCVVTIVPETDDAIKETIFLDPRCRKHRV